MKHLTSIVVTIFLGVAGFMGVRLYDHGERISKNEIRTKSLEQTDALLLQEIRATRDGVDDLRSYLMGRKNKSRSK